MGHAGGHEHGGAGRSFDLPIAKAERQGAFENVPAFIVGIMDVQVIGSAATPLMDLKGLSLGCDWQLARGTAVRLGNQKGLCHRTGAFHLFVTHPPEWVRSPAGASSPRTIHMGILAVPPSTALP